MKETIRHAKRMGWRYWIIFAGSFAAFVIVGQSLLDYYF